MPYLDDIYVESLATLLVYLNGKRDISRLKEKVGELERLISSANVLLKAYERYSSV